jgi:hypothetical protein
MISRTVDEWITVARISRSVKHLFVEGETDARLLSHLFGYPSDIDIRTAREVDKSSLPAHPMRSGFKLRLIELASTASVQSTSNIACFIDADFDRLVSNLKYPDNILLTEYANLPVCTLTYDWLQSFFIKAYGFVLTDDIWKFSISTLNYSFVARFISAKQDKPRGSPELSDYIRHSKGGWYFEKLLYTAHFFGLDKFSAGPRMKSVEDECDLYDGDHRNFVNSNDLFELLYAILRQSKTIGGGVARDTIKHTYFGSMDDDLLEVGVAAARSWTASGS